MEGKEVRFGINASSLFATITTAASCGAVNAMHDSFTPLGGAVPLVLMHSLGAPATMQDDPRYGDVLLDVYDALAAGLAAAKAQGIDRDKIMLDPGIGFGKTAAHNLTLIRGLSLLHGLGCPILLGASRKRFIGSIGGAEASGARLPGSLAVALAGFAQGVQITRVHDVAETRQALRLWQAVTTDQREGQA